MEASVSEIHRYSLRPESFEEPLFPTGGTKRAVAKHLLEAPWLVRALELEGNPAGGQAARVRREPVELEKRCGRVRVSWVSGGRRRCKQRWVIEVLDRWREVGAWWDEGLALDRVVIRALLSDGGIVNLAREGSGAWFLVGVVD